MNFHDPFHMYKIDRGCLSKENLDSIPETKHPLFKLI